MSKDFFKSSHPDLQRTLTEAKVHEQITDISHYGAVSMAKYQGPTIEPERLFALCRDRFFCGVSYQSPSDGAGILLVFQNREPDKKDKK